MGPLAGVKVIEMKGIGPGPYAGMLLADMGAEVIVVERSSKPNGIAIPAAKDCNSRGKRSIALNLKSQEGQETLLKLVEKADVLFEGFRPGVAERLGFGPEICQKRNPKLIYGRLTGWGQFGPLANTAGHDVNYIALTGALAAIGEKESPVIPLNLIGDYAAGSHFLVMGILAALLELKESGQGQVIDAAITDGSANLMSIFHSLHGPKDFKHIMNPEYWNAYKDKFTSVFKSKSRDEWCEILQGTDVCFAPVLDFIEAKTHPHNRARETYLTINGLTQPAPAPRFSRTVSEVQNPPSSEGADTQMILLDNGFTEQEINELQNKGVLS